MIPGKMPELIERIRNAMEAAGVFRNCTECMYWKSDGEMCDLYKQRPPAQVIIDGCDSFDVIPF